VPSGWRPAEVHLADFVAGARAARGLVVVIDVFRAFSVAAHAFARGARTIIPVADIADARELKRLHPHWLLIGERHARPLPGFDAGNSPEIAQLEGITLVNASLTLASDDSKWRFARTGEFVSEHATIQERFIFDKAGERFTYQATYTDPAVLTRPFTVTIPNRRITEKTPQDGWNNITFPAIHSGTEPIIEAYERTCVENNGEHGGVAVESK